MNLTLLCSHSPPLVVLWSPCCPCPSLHELRPGHTLKLGWRDAGNEAAFLEASPFSAGEGGLGHQGWVREATIQGFAAHDLVPVPRGACKHDVPLEIRVGSGQVYTRRH